MASSCAEYQKIIDILTQEYTEFKIQAKDYEDALESEISEKDVKIDELSKNLEILENDYLMLRRKYEIQSIEIGKLLNDVDSLKKKIKLYDDQKRDLEELNDQWEKSARILEYSKQDLEDRLNQAEETAILYKEEIEELVQTKEIEMQRLLDQYNELKQEISCIERADNNQSKSKPKAEIVKLDEAIAIPARSQSRNPSKPPSRTASRGHSRKDSIDSAENCQLIKVIVRVRPPLKCEVWDKSYLVINSNSIKIKEPKSKSEAKIFDFESIINPEQDEEHMFSQVRDCISHVLSGKNACIMAYGQTGSGKTYTMNSIIAKSIAQLEPMVNAEVSIQCIEVYNEQIKNLCQNESSAKMNKDSSEILEIKLNSHWQCQALQIIQEALLRRTTKFTESNERSSRSHAIFSLNILTHDFRCQVQFVDLAGSERIGKSNATGETLKEALLINKSLSALQDVISALENKQKHVPYRNSTLTKLLAPTLGGRESMVAMIVNCSPSLESLNETASTLALASRVKAVDLGFSIGKNLKTKEVERTLALLVKERSEKNALLRSLDKMHRDLESYIFAVKDRDNKIALLSNKIKLRDKVYSEVRKQRVEVLKSGGIAKKGVKNEAGKVKNRNLIHLNIKDIGRVVSLSPTIVLPSSPVFIDKPSRIPVPSVVNLKLGHSVKD